MGKGDIKSRRGKLFAGSFGKRRPAKKSRKKLIPVVPEITKPIENKVIKKDAKSSKPKAKEVEKLSKSKEPEGKSDSTSELIPKKEETKDSVSE